MKILKLWIIVAALCVSLPVTAEIRTIAAAYEIALNNVRMPTSENGVLSFKRCATCDVQRVSVTSQTQYILNDENIEIKELRRSLLKVRERASVTVIVKHHLESDTIIWVSVTL